MLSSHGGLLTIAIYIHGETLYGETKKSARNSQIVRAKVAKTCTVHTFALTMYPGSYQQFQNFSFI